MAEAIRSKRLAIVDLRRKITTALLQRRYRGSYGLSLANTQALIVGKEERAVLYDRATKGNAELILLVRRNGLVRRIEEILGIQLLIT